MKQVNWLMDQIKSQSTVYHKQSLVNKGDQVPHKIWIFNLSHEQINLKTKLFIFYDLPTLGQSQD